MSDDDDQARFISVVRDAALVDRTAAQFLPDIAEIWAKGNPPGASTGWLSIDAHYTVVPGQLTIVTGWPGSGKSEFVDALMLNLARQGWRFAIYSPENYPTAVHVIKLLEKLLGKPFGFGPTERIREDELAESVDEMRDWFGFLTPAVDTQRELFTIEDVLIGAELRFRLLGIWGDAKSQKGIVIDPWNELEHLRPQHTSETEYISATLTMLRSWARRHAVHVWLVAHPQKLKREEGRLPIPRPDSISGSQHWWNKSDNALTVWRDLEAVNPDRVAIHIQKIRFKNVGKIGVVELNYDRVTGKYHDIQRQKGLYSVGEREPGWDA